jgi:hypothetical protein
VTPWGCVALGNGPSRHRGPGRRIQGTRVRRRCAPADFVVHSRRQRMRVPTISVARLSAYGFERPFGYGEVPSRNPAPRRRETLRDARGTIGVIGFVGLRSPGGSGAMGCARVARRRRTRRSGSNIGTLTGYSSAGAMGAERLARSCSSRYDRGQDQQPRLSGRNRAWWTRAVPERQLPGRLPPLRNRIAP